MVENTLQKGRYPLPDVIRGTVSVNAVVYHMIWDLVYILGVDWKWYRREAPIGGNRPFAGRLYCSRGFAGRWEREDSKGG